MIKTVLFDLDGTLLPMEQDKFVKDYFGRLAQKLAPHGYEPQTLFPAVWSGVSAMVKNDGRRTNAEVFWEEFCRIFGERARNDMPLFEEFYEVEFNGAREVCGFQPAAAETVRFLKERGRKLVLASNPVFPLTAQKNRMRWAGTDPEEFCYITSYENSRFCKPDPRYYREILQTLRLVPEECLMVGNDVKEDGAALQAGMRVFLLTDCLLNPENADLSSLPHGGYDRLRTFLEEELREGDGMPLYRPQKNL